MLLTDAGQMSQNYMLYQAYWWTCYGSTLAYKHLNSVNKPLGKDIYRQTHKGVKTDNRCTLPHWVNTFTWRKWQGHKSKLHIFFTQYKHTVFRKMKQVQTCLKNRFFRCLPYYSAWHMLWHLLRGFLKRSRIELFGETNKSIITN